MSMLRFNDGVTFDTSGPLRIVYRRDGLYVVGQGLMIPVRDANEGRELMYNMSRNDSREQDA